MQIRLALLLICLNAASCENSADFEGFVDGSFPEVKSEYLDLIVGQLSGKYHLANGSRINSRWSKSERNITKYYLKELLQTLDIEPQEQDYLSSNLNPAIDLILNPFSGTNVYGVIPSTKGSSEYIILGAHYDSGKRNAPGAIDNATGMALIYAVAKEVSKLTFRNRNLLVVFFDQEEEELIGSKAFAEFIKEKQWDIHSVHSFDMVGWDSDNDMAVEVYSPSQNLIQAYKSVAYEREIPVRDILINPIGYNRNSTDFDAFVTHGFEVIGVGECYYHGDSSPFKDTPQDTYETVNFNYLLSCTNLIEELIKQMINET